MKKSLLFLLFLLHMAFLFGQQPSKITGQVLSAVDGSPIHFANLYLSENRGTSSDENGFYELQLANHAIDTTLTVSAIGFKTKKITLSVLKINATIVLDEAIFSLDEVVVTPLNAFPIIKESNKNNKQNFKTKWVSAKMKVTQTLFVEYDSVPNKKHFLGTMKMYGNSNFKGYSNESLVLQIDTVETTADFTRFDTLKKPPFGTEPIRLNLYDFYDQYEFSGLAKKGKGFLLKEDFSKNYRKVIDFETINGRKHYLIKTKPVRTRNQGYTDAKDLKKDNERSKAAKKKLAADAQAFGQNQAPITDSVLTHILQKSKTHSDLLGYAWIDYENYGVRRLFYKSEMYDKDGKTFHRRYRHIRYTRFKEAYLPQEIEVLLKAFSLKGTHIYRHVKIEFNDYGSDSDFNPIAKENVLNPYLYLKNRHIRLPLNTEIEKKDFSRLKYKSFLKPLRKNGYSALDDFLERSN